MREYKNDMNWWVVAGIAALLIFWFKVVAPIIAGVS